MFTLVLATGCNARRNTVHFNPKVDETEDVVDTENNEDEESTDSESEEDTTEVETGPDFSVSSPDLEDGNLDTISNYHIIKGTTPKNTAKIKVNDYTLSRYYPGQISWSYIASTGINTLEEGENEFTIKAFDKDDNEIGSESFTITYTAPEMPELPNVGSNEWIAFIISLTISGLIFGRKKLQKIFIKK